MPTNACLDSIGRSKVQCRSGFALIFGSGGYFRSRRDTAGSCRTTRSGPELFRIVPWRLELILTRNVARRSGPCAADAGDDHRVAAGDRSAGSRAALRAETGWHPRPDSDRAGAALAARHHLVAKWERQDPSVSRSGARAEGLRKAAAGAGHPGRGDRGADRAWRAGGLPAAAGPHASDRRARHRAVGGGAGRGVHRVRRAEGRRAGSAVAAADRSARAAGAGVRLGGRVEHGADRRLRGRATGAGCIRRRSRAGGKG